MYRRLHLCSCRALQLDLLAKMTCTADVCLPFRCSDFDSTNSTHYSFYRFTHTTFYAFATFPYTHALLFMTWGHFTLTQVLQSLHSFMFGRVAWKVNGQVLTKVWELLDMFVHVLKLLIWLWDKCSTVRLDLSSLVTLLTSFQSIRLTQPVKVFLSLQCQMQSSFAVTLINVHQTTSKTFKRCSV